MLNVDSVYLTKDKGLTSTSANHLANLAKEVLKDCENQLVHLCFVSKTVELINGSKKTLRIGRSDTEKIDELIQTIGKMHSFIAWIREAIREKNSLISRASGYTLEEYLEDNNLSTPERPEEFRVTDETIINEMNIKERNRYFTLEAYAAAYGQYIHPDGSISSAREDYYEKVNEPTTVSGSGRDALIYSYTPSISKEELESMFMSLQSKHREYEKQLNAIKFKIKEEVNKRNLELTSKYKLQLEEYSTEMGLLRSAHRKRMLELQEEVSKLKVALPEELMDTFEYLNSLG